MPTLFDTLESARRGAKLTVRAKRSPTAQQQEIIHLIRAGQRTITVQAGPGSGKTTLLEMLAAELDAPDRLLGFLSFGKHIVKTLKQRLPANFKPMTINSLGDQIVRANQPGCAFDPQKYPRLIQAACKAKGSRSASALHEMKNRVTQCIDLQVGHNLGLDLSLHDWIAALSAAEAPLLGSEHILYDLCHEVLNAGLTEMVAEGIISFPDQLLAPSVLKWTLPSPYDVLLIDELQDLSAAHLDLLIGATHENSVVIGVGDAHQSLFDWNGADRHAIERFTALFKAQSRPLNVSFRCPARHIALARKYGDPQLQAAPNAIQGTLADITSDDFLRLAQPGDLALCRINGPLVDWFYRLIAQGTPAVVRGHDLSKSLRSMAKDVATWENGQADRSLIHDSLTLTNFNERLDEYVTHLAARAKARAEQASDHGGNAEFLHEQLEMQYARYADQLSAMSVIYEQSSAATLGDLLDAIRSLFVGNGESSVVLSTIHRAKGLEAPQVFILAPELLPHPRAQSEAARAAERCVQYVALTRATQSLYFVEPPQSLITLPTPEGRTPPPVNAALNTSDIPWG